MKHSGFQMALFLVVDPFFLALLSPLGGAIADRTSRKSILVAMDLARALVALALAILYQLGVLQVWMLYVGAVGLSTCAAVFGPAPSAIIPNVVDAEGLPKARPFALGSRPWGASCGKAIVTCGAIG